MSQSKAFKKLSEEVRWLQNNLYRKDIESFACDTITNLLRLYEYGCISPDFYNMFSKRITVAMNVESIYNI